MRCHYCNEKVAIHDVWCVKCGKRTELIRTQLSAAKSINKTWKQYKEYRGKNLPSGILASLLGMIPMLILIWLLNYVVGSMEFINHNLVHSAVWILFLPVMFVPFRAACKSDSYLIDAKSYLASFKSYFKYLGFSLISVLFYTVIFFVCQGDPILNLVWLVLVLYWIAIALPVPILMERYSINAWKGILLSYKSAADVRWNIFLLAIILFVANVLAIALFVVGLAVVLPFSWFAVRDYVDKLIENEIFSAGK